MPITDMNFMGEDGRKRKEALEAIEKERAARPHRDAYEETLAREARAAEEPEPVEEPEYVVYRDGEWVMGSYFHQS